MLVSSSLTLSFTFCLSNKIFWRLLLENKIFMWYVMFNQFQIVDKSIEISMNQRDAVIVMEEIQKKSTKLQIAWFISLFASSFKKNIHSVVQTPRMCKFWYTHQKLTNHIPSWWFGKMSHIPSFSLVRYGRPRSCSPYQPTTTVLPWGRNLHHHRQHCLCFLVLADQKLHQN